MSLLFDRIPRRELGTVWKHTGWFLGLVPVYIQHLDSDDPTLVERNGIPRFWFFLVLGLFMSFCWVAQLLSEDFEPMFFLTVSGEIHQEPAS